MQQLANTYTPHTSTDAYARTNQTCATRRNWLLLHVDVLHELHDHGETVGQPEKRCAGLPSVASEAGGHSELRGLWLMRVSSR